jgi:rod shape-determining protein MreD
MKPLVTVPVALLAVLLDLAVAPGAQFFGVRPSFTLVVVALWSALRPREEAMLLAPVAGLLLGLLGTEPLGVSVLALAPLVLLGGLNTARGARRRALATVGLVAFGTLVYVPVYGVLSALFGGAAPVGWGTVRVLLFVAILNTLLAAVVYLPLARLSVDRTTHRQFRRY